jgi:hypothetical protein
MQCHVFPQRTTRPAEVRLLVCAAERRCSTSRRPLRGTCSYPGLRLPTFTDADFADVLPAPPVFDVCRRRHARTSRFDDRSIHVVGEKHRNPRMVGSTANCEAAPASPAQSPFFLATGCASSDVFFLQKPQFLKSLWSRVLIDLALQVASDAPHESRSAIETRTCRAQRLLSMRTGIARRSSRSAEVRIARLVGRDGGVVGF